MIFIDTNVFMYAVGRPHTLKQPSRAFFIEAHRSRKPLCTSAAVLQELAHVYLATERSRVLDAAVELISIPRYKPAISATWRVVDAVASGTLKPLIRSSRLSSPTRQSCRSRAEACPAPLVPLV